MTDPIQQQRSGLIQRFLGSLRYPQLFVLVAGLFVLDFFIFDPFPLFDEILLAAVTLLLGSLRERKPAAPSQPEKPPEKNITPID